ncbi:MAG: sirohydrochlorin cobaltochelatase [Peptostreptococcaceae bacterium]
MKKAIVVVSFGTTYEDRRKKSIVPIEEKIKTKFKDYEFFRCYSSKFIVSRLDSKDIYHIEETLNYLKENNYNEVIIQPLYVVCGFEYDKILNLINDCDFDSVKVGKSLLNNKTNFYEFSNRLVENTKLIEKDDSLVFMAHGSFHNEDYNYIKLENELKKINENIFIATLEGENSIQNIRDILKQRNIDTVYLYPFMLVSGRHIVTDLVSDNKGSWKSILKENGMIVYTSETSLGEYDFIQEIFLNESITLIDNN